MQYSIPFIFSMAFGLILIPILRRFALKIKLVDQPNARKVHKAPVPLIGGIAVFVATYLAMLSDINFWISAGKINIILIGAGLLLLVGVIDDKTNISALPKFTIQVLLANYVFVNGIMIESLHGVFGIEELSPMLQYILTLMVITGVVNAFNLMDGIDGLAAGIAVLALCLFSVAAFLVGDSSLLTLYIALIGALIAFLKFNFSKKQKIFMGDAGSLFIGYILVTSAIALIQQAQSPQQLNWVLIIVIGVFVLPVIDSLRVYYGRLKKGKSPFHADKTHIHHLALSLNPQHKSSSILIIAFSLLLIILNFTLYKLLGITASIIILICFFLVFSKILDLNMQVNKWRENIRKMEHNQFILPENRR